MRKVLATVLLLTAGSALLAGCDEQPSQPAAEASGPSAEAEPAPAPAPVRTVSYFLEHADELQATLHACRDDPGTLAATPDCINAAEARKRRTADEMKRALQ
jgi:uncharacterized lipoprotein YajG